MDPPGLFNKGQIATNLILREMTNHTLEPPGPGLHEHMDAEKPLFPRFMPQFRQYLITGVTAITENIFIRVTIRIAGDFRHRIQPAGLN